ncbi:MAG: phospho-N-acetylmuramoyl-pentapeptide-transferase [Coprothermobacterota bacterium]|jgi:phospho-N-acetylmuramoyl-pentapeptide-transferase|nr:phospho-N-acetylmuramoyl-pentapeptide-transferase [Coprothermobacterota bacterium]
MIWIPVLVVSFLVTLTAMPFLIRGLRSWKLTSYVRAEVTEHLHKTGTPVAGGLLFLVIPTLAALLFGVTQDMLAVLIVTLGAGLTGFVDDWLSSRGQHALGLKARYKIVAQIALALVFAFLTLPNSAIWIPFIPPLDIQGWYVPLSVFFIVWSTNAVNITDGADGLAASVFLTVLGALMVVAYLQNYISLMPFIFSLGGVLLGFLWFNVYPASVIMGDTGALALGAAMAGLSLILHIPLFLPFIAMVFLIETLSVIIQVGYFRYSGGKRVFKRAPIHHHFQLLGWSETQIVLRFSLFNLLFIGLAFLFIWV